MDIMLQVLDQRLMTNNAAQSGQSGKTQQDGQDFGAMVRQRQQGSRAQSRDSSNGAGKAQQEGKEPQEAPAAEQEQQNEAAVEQIVIAAALMLPPGVEIINFETTPEENNLSVNLEPAFAPDMHVEEVDAVPLVQAAEDGPREILQAAQEAAPEMEAQTEGQQDGPTGMEVFVTRNEDGGGEEAAEETQEAAPVFGYMEATPVKVAAASAAPVELEAEDGTEQLSQRIEEFVPEESGSSRVQITLEPASLGKVTVEITHTEDGALHIQLTASTLRAADILERNTGSLQHLLAETRNEVRVEVRNQVEQGLPQIFVNPNGDNNQNQQQQRQRREQEQDRRQDGREGGDFLQQLRLGLVSLSSPV